MASNEHNTSVNFDDLFDVNGGLYHAPLYILIYVVVFGLAALIGTVGNILVIITIMTTKSLRQTQNAFIVSLAAADLMVSSVTMPASITGVLFGKRWYDERAVLCAFVATVCAPGCVASMHSIAWIAISRYYYIGQYHKFNVYFSKKKIAAYISSIWLLSFLVHTPNHFGWGRTKYSFMLRLCTLDTDLHSYAVFYASVLVSAIVVTFVFYVRIYLVLRQSTLSRSLIVGRKSLSHRPSSSSSSLTDEIKIAKTSFKIFVLFLITWTPICVLLLISINDNIQPWIYLYAGLIAHANSTLNFVVYFLENDAFRKSLKKFVRKLFGKKNYDYSSVDSNNLRKTVNSNSRRATSVDEDQL